MEVVMGEGNGGAGRRDFRGYGPEPPNPEWPGGARVAVSLMLNIEEGAELSLADGDERNEKVYEVVDEVTGGPDLCMESHFAYGTRAGYWRIVRVLQSHGVTATVNACSRALQRSPWLARDVLDRDMEIACHSHRWERHAGMDEAAERQVVARAVAAIRRASGVRPVGWHTRSASTANTRRLLIEEGGFLYDSDAYDDDLPYVVEVAGRPHVVLPYAFDTNDMRFQGGGAFVHADDFARYCIDAYDTLWREGETRPAMMSVGLHLRLIGRPGRIAGLERFLEHVQAKGGAWFAQRRQIAEHWRRRMGLPDWQPAAHAG
jgi:peptidoglycan/xylan/chitin deacetylase (PgdA/CDA1 family)